MFNFIEAERKKIRQEILTREIDEKVLKTRFTDSVGHGDATRCLSACLNGEYMIPLCQYPLCHLNNGTLRFLWWKMELCGNF